MACFPERITYIAHNFSYCQVWDENLIIQFIFISVCRRLACSTLLAIEKSGNITENINRIDLLPFQ